LPESRQVRRWAERKRAKAIARAERKVATRKALEDDRAAFPRPKAPKDGRADFDLDAYRAACRRRVPDKFLNSHARTVRAFRVMAEALQPFTQEPVL
jgi:hypothetical protein